MDSEAAGGTVLIGAPESALTFFGWNQTQPLVLQQNQSLTRNELRFTWSVTRSHVLRRLSSTVPEQSRRRFVEPIVSLREEEKGESFLLPPVCQGHHYVAVCSSAGEYSLCLCAFPHVGRGWGKPFRAECLSDRNILVQLSTHEMTNTGIRQASESLENSQISIRCFQGLKSALFLYKAWFSNWTVL